MWEVPAMIRLLRDDEEKGGDSRASLQPLVGSFRLLGDLLDETMRWFVAGLQGMNEGWGWG